MVYLSIGATTLDEKRTFYMRIDPKSSQSFGLETSQDTLAWWMKQSNEARKEAFGGTADLLLVLGQFADWLMQVRKEEGDTFVWGNGADFDLSILSVAYQKVGIPVPWRPFNGRCYRTFKNLPEHKTIKPDPFEGVKHNALADAQHQAKHMLKILEVMKVRRRVPDLSEDKVE